MEILDKDGIVKLTIFYDVGGKIVDILNGPANTVISDCANYARANYARIFAQGADVAKIVTSDKVRGYEKIEDIAQSGSECRFDYVKRDITYRLMK